MTNSQLKKLKKNLQNSYDKIPIIAQKEEEFEGNSDADDILEKKLNDL